MINKEYNQKITLIFFVFCFIYLLVFTRLFFIQIINGEFYSLQGKNQYQVKIVAPFIRATIYDRYNKPLTINKDSYAAFITPKNIVNKKILLPFLENHFPNSYQKLNAYMNAINRHEHFMYIKRKLTDTEISLIQESGLEDIKLLKEPARLYNIKSLGSVIGITDIDNKGLFGIEKIYDDQLAGRSESYTLQKDARLGHFYFTKETQKKGNEGQEIILSIDSDLQFLIYQELIETINNFNALEGAVLIMNADNGEILAMANYPDFDPNQINIDIENTKNRIVTDVYEFGSVIKIFLATAALEEKVVTPDEIIDCENRKTTYIDHITINTWREFGQIPFVQVIEQSNNIGVAKVAKRLGSKLFNYYKNFGFGQKTGINFPGEQSGFINPPSNWSKASVFSLSYGYELNGTIIQLARAFSVFSNGGFLVTPTLLKLNNNKSKTTKPICSQQTILEIRKILENIANKDNWSKKNIEDYVFMGKTGSARLLQDGVYIEHKNIFTFCGLVEKDNYKRVIITFIKEPKCTTLYAASIALPLFRKIAEKMILKENIYK